MTTPPLLTLICKKDPPNHVRRAAVNADGRCSYCWKRGHTPTDATADPEELLGVLISAGGIRYELVDPDGRVVRRDVIQCSAKNVERVVFNGFETTNLTLFSRSRWPHDAWPDDEVGRHRLQALGHSVWYDIKSGDKNWRPVGEPAPMTAPEEAAAPAPEEPAPPPEELMSFDPVEVDAVLTTIKNLRVSDRIKAPVQDVLEEKLLAPDFRRALEERWGCHCAVTGITARECLAPCRIKPWAECTTQERMDPCNGLLLNVSLAPLFLKHLITFGADGVLRTSPRLDAETVEALHLQSDLRLRPEFDMEQCRSYFEHHWVAFELKSREAA